MTNHDQIVCMGSYGDLCLVLPFAYDQFRTTGQKATIIVSQNYADILDGVSYVNPIIYPENWKRGQDPKIVLQAVQWVHEKTGRRPTAWVNPVESFGERKQTGESFVHEMWRTLGRPNDWRSLPLVFDKRDAEREAELVKGLNADQKIILLALNGVASPFPERADLVHAVQEDFPNAVVVDLSVMRAERPYDLLSLMDHAHLLIAADTLALHLSGASQVPVIALSRDLPTHWNGTPWHSRYELHCRYSQYAARKPEILHTAKRVLAGVRRPRQLPIVGTEANGYNPSLVRFNGELVTSYRYHPHGSWKTKLALATLESYSKVRQHFQVKLPHSLEAYSAEDMRLWLKGDRLMGSFVSASVVGHNVRCVMRYGEVINGGVVEMRECWQPKYGVNDMTGLEKNWVFFEHGGRTHFIYACRPEHVIAEVDRDTVTNEWKTPALYWSWGDIRGGTPPVLFRGKWLRFFHSQFPISPKPRDCRYYVGAYLMNNEPPFEMLAVSSHPILSGHEWRNNAAHWKGNVMIPYGVVDQDGGWLLSVGVNDAAACLVKITEAHLNLL